MTVPLPCPAFLDSRSDDLLLDSEIDITAAPYKMPFCRWSLKFISSHAPLRAMPCPDPGKSSDQV